MKSLNDEMDTFKKIIKGIAAQFGSNCEVVLHDMTIPIENSIVAIENGHITGRTIGGCGTSQGLDILSGVKRPGDTYNYITQLPNGNLLRSSSIYIKDPKGKNIGAICINYDITNLVYTNKLLGEFTFNSVINENAINETSTLDLASDSNEVIASDINELLDVLLQNSVRIVNVPVSRMSKDEKIKGLAYLDKKGAFLIKKAGDKIAKFYDISRFLLYSYLDEIRDKDNIENNGE